MELNEEQFFAAFGVALDGSVDETEPSRFVDQSEDPAAVSPPGSEDLRCIRDHGALFDQSGVVGEDEPVAVELLPTSERVSGGGEVVLAVSDLGFESIDEPAAEVAREFAFVVDAFEKAGLVAEGEEVELVCQAMSRASCRTPTHSAEPGRRVLPCPTAIAGSGHS